MSAVEQATTTDPAPSRRGLRLRLVHDESHPRLDGGWWPHTRDPIAEIQDLVWKFPAEFGRISRVQFSPPDWDSAPRSVPLGTRSLRVGSLPTDDTHLLLLQTLSRRRLTLLVVPSTFEREDAEAALCAASAPGNQGSGTDVLEAIAAHRRHADA